MEELTFHFSEFDREILAITDIARQFLAPGAEEILGNLKGSLDRIRRDRGGNRHQWTTQKGLAIRTRSSCGDRDFGGAESRPLSGRVSFTWEIEPLYATKTRPATDFRLAGIASTRLAIVDEETDGQLARWNMEIGDINSPGCHFHVQVKEEDSVTSSQDTRLFPDWLSIPRLPAYFTTPALALEFLLGELFQGEWHRHISRDTDAVNYWHGIQSERFKRVFEWQQGIVSRSSGSPWTSLKMEKPDSDLFTR